MVISHNFKHYFKSSRWFSLNKSAFHLKDIQYTVDVICFSVSSTAIKKAPTFQKGLTYALAHTHQGLQLSTKYWQRKLQDVT